MADVLESINSLPSKPSCGIDDFSAKLLKYVKNKIAPIITLIFNQSVATEIFPDKLRIAKVVPVFKKDNPTLISNYRPTSLLPVISKVFERILHDQITAHLQSNDLP